MTYLQYERDSGAYDAERIEREAWADHAAECEALDAERWIDAVCTPIKVASALAVHATEDSAAYVARKGAKITLWHGFNGRVVRVFIEPRRKPRVTLGYRGRAGFFETARLDTRAESITSAWARVVAWLCKDHN